MTTKKSIEAYLVKKLATNDRARLKTILGRLDKNTLIDYFLDHLSGVSREETVPVSIFSNEKLGAYEALVKYLKEEHPLTNNRIADLLQRSQQSVWTSLNKAERKHSHRLKIEYSENDIPLELFRTKASTLKTVVSYLKEERKLRLSEIARLMNRDLRSIWAVYHRRGRR